MTAKGKRMMEEELRQLLKEYGWSLYKGKRRERVFYYALKWKEDQVYITAQSKLSKLTKEEVLKKIHAS